MADPDQFDRPLEHFLQRTNLARVEPGVQGFGQCAYPWIVWGVLGKSEGRDDRTEIALWSAVRRPLTYFPTPVRLEKQLGQLLVVGIWPISSGPELTAPQEDRLVGQSTNEEIGNSARVGERVDAALSPTHQWA